MNRAEYNRCRRKIEREYLRRLADLEAEYAQANPGIAVERGKERPSERANRAIMSMEDVFTIRDVQERHRDLYPDQPALYGASVGKCLAALRFQGKVELVTYGGPNRPDEWRVLKPAGEERV